MFLYYQFTKYGTFVNIENRKVYKDLQRHVSCSVICISHKFQYCVQYCLNLAMFFTLMTGIVQLKCVIVSIGCVKGLQMVACLSVHISGPQHFHTLEHWSLYIELNIKNNP